ncbi:hypothetical protein BGW36DRAFT_457672 [Talaromyces proteolyticus]|uniref:PNPLA domain-containing protein n=1 Tax=Talaromyces proteolyticus TaxID=1131652 RepID=A0AAD4L0A7_9EURO|nr:uncharacterized protein BGW36DRAFT_457672 [Talaromyces proteolyticus]KAH8703381.1 hypothetical protein BGW36DRAFT_457672 [Talaromyces proteolyticus]
MAEDNFSYSESETVSVNPSCVKCEEGVHSTELLLCKFCEEYLCPLHWDEYDPHKKGRNVEKHQKTSLNNDEIKNFESAREFERSLFTEPGEAEHEKLHEQDLATVWFGIDAKTKQGHSNPDVYGEIILRSTFYPRSRQFPSLVSFIGTTGAGKSTLVKGIIDVEPVKTETNDRNWLRSVPVQGIRSFFMKPTTSDVHLYHDPQTLHTDRPLLLADCEGFGGAMEDPVGSILKKGVEYTAKFWPLHSSTEKDHGKLTRKFCVETIYPRILYAFSDILCYVIQQNPRVIEEKITKIILWAEKVHDASLNQVTLPRAVLVLNNISMSREEMKMWKDAATVTAYVTESLRKKTNFAPELLPAVEKWNAILPGEGKINSLLDLFLQYFRSVSIVCVPHHTEEQLATGFFNSVKELRKLIVDLSNEVHEQRQKVSRQINSIQLESYLSKGIEHFFTKFDEPFDIYKFAMDHQNVPESLTDHAVYLMKRIREEEYNPKAFDERCAKLIASYHTMRAIIRQEELGVLRLQDPTYVEPYRTAYKVVQESSRCWFHDGRNYCRCIRDGHTKGHYDAKNQFIGCGNYESPYTEESCIQFEKKIIELSNEIILSGSVSSRLEFQINKHTTILKNERSFWLKTFSNKVCFSCLVEVPEFRLKCGHRICRACVKIFGKQAKQEFIYQLDSCILCSEGSYNDNPYATIQLKPTGAGARILAIDGGGVRGVISARILQFLENEIGLQLPLHHFFDVIIGTSSGGILSLALGANLWDADTCVNKFRSLASVSFSQRLLTKLPIIGGLFGIGLHSYYEPEPIEKALVNTFTCATGKRYLSHEPRIYKSDQKEGDHLKFYLRELNVGVTTVNTISNEAVLMSNYNRKQSKDDSGAKLYRADQEDDEIEVWQAGRCTSAAPSIFPTYRAPNRQSFQDGGLKHNNPIGLAVKEGKILWPDSSDVDIAVSIGSGYAETRLADGNVVHGYAVHGWLKRCIDVWESSLDSERLWQEYSRSLDPEEKSRHHRLNVKISDTLPFMADVAKIDDMEEQAIRFYSQPDSKQQLRRAAEASIAALFYIRIDRVFQAGRDSYNYNGRILCRLEKKHHLRLLKRLQESNCTFLINDKINDMDFSKQENRIQNGDEFQQHFHWNTARHLQAVDLCLAFVAASTEDKENEIHDNVGDTSSIYHISGSPFRRSLAN